MLNTDLCSETFFSGLSAGISIPLTISLGAESTVCEGGEERKPWQLSPGVLLLCERIEKAVEKSQERK